MTMKRTTDQPTRTPPQPAAEQKTVAQPPGRLHDVECAWVPGTTDRVRFTLLRHGMNVKHQVRELAVARLEAMFGRTLMDDLYLRGRAQLRLSDGQLLELA
jgi:hypothetical protein